MTGTGMLSDFTITVIGKLCRCKLLFVSVGGGPIRHPLSRCFVKAALALADYRSYRDASSKDHLEATNDVVYPDLAFSLLTARKIENLRFNSAEICSSIEENAPAIESRITPKMESYRAALDEQYVRILEGICSG
jgi:polysaccharide pyruvyl transferase WcaK-like protein